MSKVVALLGVVVACNQPRPDLVDAGRSGNDGAVVVDARGGDVVDAAVDALPDAPTVGLVEVVVYTWDGQPAANTPVLFQNADDTVVATARTDADGVASAVMASGGKVTAVQPPPPGETGTFLMTFVGVVAGDRLLAGDPAAPPSRTSFAAMVTLPAYTGPVATAHLEVTTRCGGGTAPHAPGSQTIPVTLACSPVDIYARAYVSHTSQTLESFLVKNVAVTAGETIDLSAEPFKRFQRRDLTFTQLPPNASSAFVSASTWSDGFVHDSYLAAITIDGSGTATEQIRFPEVVDVALGVRTTMRVGSNRYHERMHIAPLATTTTAVVAELARPHLVELDLRASQIRWSLTAGAAAEITKARLLITRATGDRVDWRLASRYTPGELGIPVLGTSFADFNPTATDTVQIRELSFATLPGGWAARRATAFRPLVHHYATMWPLGGSAEIVSIGDHTTF